MTSIERVTSVAHGKHGVHADVRSHRVTTDRPKDMGGEDRGLMASEHLLVALASCTCTTAVKIAEKRSVPLERVAADAEMEFDERGEVSAIRVHVRLTTAAAEKDARKVVELAERVCTISKLIGFPVQRTMSIVAP